MSITRNILSLFLFVLVGTASGQPADTSCTFTLSGSVIDEHDRSPLSFSEIFIPSLGIGDVADEQGRFSIDRLCPGKYTVRVMHLGCEPIERTIDLRKDLEVQFMLEHHAEELQELEVIRKRPDENVGQVRVEMDAAEIERSTGKDIANMLARIPGVNIVKTGPHIAKPMIHGLYGNRILMLNHGIRQEDQQWGTEHAPFIDPFSSDRLAVIKGAAAVQYGADAMGGVVIVEPVSLDRTKGVEGEIRMFGSSNGRGGGMAGAIQGRPARLNKLAWRLQGSTRLKGDQHAPEYVLSNTGLREAAGTFSIEWKGRRQHATAYYSVLGREMGILRASHIGNLTDLQQAIERQRPWYVAPFTYAIEAPRQTGMHQLLKVETGMRLGQRDQLIFTYGRQRNTRQEFDVRRGEARKVPALDLLLTTHSGDLVLKHWLGERLHGKAGLNAIHQENLNVPGTGVEPLIPNHVKRTLGAFILEHYPITEKLELEAGARLESSTLKVYRYDENSIWTTTDHAFLNSALVLGAKWELRPKWSLHINGATAYRPPHVSELYSNGLHHGAGIFEIGDPGLASERSLKFVAGVEGFTLGDRLGLNVTVYRDRIADHIYLRPSGYILTIRGAFPVFEHTATDAVLSGLDAMADLALSKDWRFRSRYSMVRGRDLRANGPLYLMPPDRIENSIVFERAAAGGWKDIEAELISAFVFEQTRIQEGIDLAPPPPAYHLLNGSISASRAIGSNELRLGITVNNLLNTTYRDFLDRSRYFADAPGMDVGIWARLKFGRSNN